MTHVRSAEASTGPLPLPLLFSFSLCLFVGTPLFRFCCFEISRLRLYGNCCVHASRESPFFVIFNGQSKSEIASTRYCTTGVDKRVRSTSLYHCRQCIIVLKPRSDRTDYTVLCFVMHDCRRKLRKHSTSSS